MVSKKAVGIFMVVLVVFSGLAIVSADGRSDPNAECAGRWQGEMYPSGISQGRMIDFTLELKGGGLEVKEYKRGPVVGGTGHLIQDTKGPQNEIGAEAKAEYEEGNKIILTITFAKGGKVVFEKDNDCLVRVSKDYHGTMRRVK